MLFFCLPVYAQNDVSKKDSSNLHLNPLLLSSFKKPVKPNPSLNEHFKSPNNQLMYWPNYPLTAAQIEERDKRNNRPFKEQIVHDVIDSYIDGLIKGKPKKPVAKPPHF